MNSYKSEAVDGLVSVIMPVYNCEKFIVKTIESVLAQTYHFFELIVVDDNSSDSSYAIISSLCADDERIKCYRLESNSGAAVARNTAVNLAKGEFLAFLDADDLWLPDKLEKQLDFMKNNNAQFCCTAYYPIDEFGMISGKKRDVLPTYNYKLVLKEGIGNSTVIYNAAELGKFTIEPIRKRNDYLMWLSVIKVAKLLHGYPEPLTFYRVHSGGISRNKVSLLKYHWIVYRRIEHLSFFYSTYLMCVWSIKTLVKTFKSIVCKGASNDR